MVTQSNEVERPHENIAKEVEAVEILNQIESSRHKLTKFFIDVIFAKVQLLRKFMAMLSIYNEIKLKYLEKGDRSYI